MKRSRTPSAVLVVALLAASPVAASAQGHGGHEGHGAPRADTATASAHDHHAMTEAAMAGGAMAANPHLVLTPARAAGADDQRRAAEIAATLRRAIDKYRDVKLAERDGYRMFAPQVKAQRVYHFTSRRSAVRNAFDFDAARPTSLLYERGKDGALVLVGAMYTAPKNASLEELDRRVPLGVARWHRHVAICVPRLGERERWMEKRDGRPLFGPAGVIASREACDAEGGRFLPSVFGWMVHANVFASDDPRVVWGDEHHGASAQPPNASAETPPHEH